MNEMVQVASFTRTLRLKVKAESYGWLNKAAVEVNQVFNWGNATSIDAADRNRRTHARFLTGFDLCNLRVRQPSQVSHRRAAGIGAIEVAA
jgi:hypothetical protein